jgi:tRNA(His) 5'-end guanylyltransferase
MDSIEKLKQIKINNLSDIVSNMVNYPVSFNEIKIHKNGKYISFDSNSLIEYTGIMKDHYERFQISSFSNGFASDNDDTYWVMLSFSFTYTGGGSNGYTFGIALYNFKTESWSIKKHNDVI